MLITGLTPSTLTTKKREKKKKRNKRRETKEADPFRAVFAIKIIFIPYVATVIRNVLSSLSLLIGEQKGWSRKSEKQLIIIIRKLIIRMHGKEAGIKYWVLIQRVYKRKPPTVNRRRTWWLNVNASTRLLEEEKKGKQFRILYIYI